MGKRKILSKENIIIAVLLFIYAVLEFRVHRIIVFYADDLWYETNLVTGEKLRNLKDIWESQYWHFFNWGGRSINHAVLQLILMCGEFVADILNMLAQFLLAFIVCKCAGARKFITYAFTFVAMISLNPEPLLSMFWEAGSANYLYASIWIFVYALLYMREYDEPSKRKYPWIELWIIPLAIMTGWSNENIGPAMFMFSVGAIIFVKVYHKVKVQFWMYEGSVLCLAGCIPLIIAPGNYVRSGYSDSGILDRIVNIVNATSSYIFPVLIFTAFLVILYTAVCKKKMRPSHYAMIAYAAVSHGAMFMSPIYPSRPAFGILIALLVVDASLIDEMLDLDKEFGKWIKIIIACVFVIGLAKLVGFNLTPPV